MLKHRAMCVTSVPNFVELGTPCELTNTASTILLVNMSIKICWRYVSETNMEESVPLKIVLLRKAEGIEINKYFYLQDGMKLMK